MVKFKVNKLNTLLFVFFTIILMCSCYHSKSRSNEIIVNDSADIGQIDSFKIKHNYSLNYNFIVKSDSIVLYKQQPEELLLPLQHDTIVVYKNNHLVVADIRILPNDTIGSVWVQVARDQQTFGWIKENVLLKNVVPDDPISVFISTFSDTHLLIFLIIISLISVYYIMRKLLSENLPIVHFHDIESFYPTLLVLLVAISASFYSSIQNFAPELWQHFYFNPTLNPFSVSMPLNLFLFSVWAIIIVALASVSEVRHNLYFSDAILYLCGLAGFCAINYIIFSITTLYYIGYPLLIAYCVWAIIRYFKNQKTKFVCGNCGARLINTHKCPNCGAINDFPE